MNAPSSFPSTLSQEVRILGSHFGSLLGPEYKIGVGDKYFWVGELTLKLLQSGTPIEDFELFEIDPDAPDLED